MSNPPCAHCREKPMNPKIAEDFREVERQNIRAALDAAYVRGYQLGFLHGEKLESLRDEQQADQLRSRGTLDGLVPEPIR
jgi:hypothetical protein